MNHLSQSFSHICLWNNGSLHISVKYDGKRYENQNSWIQNLGSAYGLSPSHTFGLRPTFVSWDRRASLLYLIIICKRYKILYYNILFLSDLSGCLKKVSWRIWSYFKWSKSRLKIFWFYSRPTVLISLKTPV